MPFYRNLLITWRGRQTAIVRLDKFSVIGENVHTTDCKNLVTKITNMKAKKLTAANLRFKYNKFVNLGILIIEF